jgi:hypothetical protein
LEPAPVDPDADAEERGTIDHHAMLTSGRLGDGPLRDMSHRREMIALRGMQLGSGRVSPSGST